MTMAGANTKTTNVGDKNMIKPILYYDFEGDNKIITDKIGDNHGRLHGKATIRKNEETGSNTLYLNGTTGTYGEFPKGFFDGKNTLTISMDILSNMENQNFFTLAIGKDSSKYLFLRTRSNQVRYAITKSSYSNEQDVSYTGNINDVWANITLVLTNMKMELYLNGELVDSQYGINTSISSLGKNLLGYIGKSFYNGDSYFKGYIDNIKIYDKALTAKEVATELGVKLNAFRNIKASNSSLVASVANKDTKEVTLYISKSRNERLEDIELKFDFNEGVKILTEEPVKISINEIEEVTFQMESEDGVVEEQTWTLTPVLSNNPVLKGQYADPDIDVFGDKYYMYTTTDGYAGWSGTKFHVFSSDNLVDWVDEGVILDVASDDVKWSIGSAWAPSIEEKNGKYYFYFCAKDTSGVSSIGVAVADSPTGPFTSEEEPIITQKMCTTNGIVLGQAIDPSIFTDDDGSSYMLFGNGDAAVVKLNDDMVSVDLSTLKNYTGVKDFREAITATKKDGIYHFTWSCDDTGSADYHVNYGTSHSIYGPIKYKHTVLSKEEESDILGTGHHCMLQIPNTEEYYIAYHRFYTPLGTYTDGFGFHRETCIDVVEFDSNGLMKTITPTHEGVKERVLTNMSDIENSNDSKNDMNSNGGSFQDEENSDDFYDNNLFVGNSDNDVALSTRNETKRNKWLVISGIAILITFFGVCIGLIKRKK